MENQEKREMMIDAFPNESHNASCRGMTLKDYFASSAMQGIIASTQGIGLEMNERNIQIVVKKAYMYADAMLKEREKQE